MNQLNYFKNKIESISVLNVIKIIILIFISIALIANFYPYYEGWDSLVYGISAISLSQGSFGITNELLAETGDIEFVPSHWTKTVHNTAIPIASPAILGLSAFFYLIGGYYGLFYIGPIFSIIFLIVSERIATKVFGGFVGLFTLVFLSTDFIFLRTGVQLLTDNIFAIFFILGCFFLIKFFQIGKEKFVLLSTVFFVISAFFRFNGIIFFPLEIFMIGVFFSIKFLTNFQNQNKFQESSVSLYKNKKHLSKIFGFILIPWLIFFIFWFSFNDYYFGDPFMTYYSMWSVKSDISSIFEFNSNRFESVKYYSAELIPDVIKSSLRTLFPTENFENNKDLQSVFALIILSFAFLLSLMFKNKRLEIIVFLAFLGGMLMFFSSEYATSIGKAERFMIPNLSISFMLLGFIFSIIWRRGIQNKLKSNQKGNSIIVKSLLVIILIIIPPLALLDTVKITSEEVLLYETKATQRAKSGFSFNNPQDYVERFPLDNEGLTNKSIIVASEGRRIVEYNAIPISTYAGGVFPIDGVFNPEMVPYKPIQSLMKLIKDGYDVYTFKEHWWEIDPQYFRYIEKEYGLILKDYSTSFCKMELTTIANTNENKVSQSDDVCYVYLDRVIPKN